MSFTTINTFNSNLWKGGVVKTTLYGLSVKTNDISVNSINVNYRFSNDISYVTMDIIGSSGYISSQPRYNVTSNPVTNTISGLNPNTYYNFVLVPYNNYDISGSRYYFNGFTSGASTFTSTSTDITSISTPVNYSNLVKPFCTLSTTSQLIYANITSNIIDISFNYSDLSYVIISSNPLILTGGNTTPATISKNNIKLPIKYTGLTPDISYNFTINPYNSANLLGLSIGNTFTTLSTVSNFVSTNTTINRIDISFNYSDLSYINITSNPQILTGSNTTGTNTTPKFISKNNIILPIIYTGLTSGLSYIFTITPYNHANLIGANIINTFTTLSTVTNLIAPTITSNQINISFNYSDLSYVIITSSPPITIGSNLTPATIRKNNIILPIIYTGLTSDIIYNFTVNPYNYSNIIGISLSNNFRTLSSVTNLIYTNNTTERIDISFNYSDLSYITIDSTPQILTGGNLTPATISKSNIILPIIYSGLPTDVSYIFTVTPYNHSNSIGLFISNTFSTLSSVSNLVSTNITNNRIDISFNYSDLSYITIISTPQILTGGNITPATISKSNIILPIIYSGLIPDTIYSFTMYPYNHSNLIGLSLNNTFTTTCNPILTNIYFDNINYLTANMNFNSECVSFINISMRDSNYDQRDFTISNSISPYTITDLLEGYTYTLYIRPYNRFSQPGTQYIVSFSSKSIAKSLFNGSRGTINYGGTLYASYYMTNTTGSLIFADNVIAKVIIVGDGDDGIEGDDSPARILGSTRGIGGNGGRVNIIDNINIAKDVTVEIIIGKPSSITIGSTIYSSANSPFASGGLPGGYDGARGNNGQDGPLWYLNNTNYGGGGGCCSNYVGTNWGNQVYTVYYGGAGGGGNGGEASYRNLSLSTGKDGTINTGGGGGGGAPGSYYSYGSYKGGKGGRGIIIIAVPFPI